MNIDKIDYHNLNHLSRAEFIKLMEDFDCIIYEELNNDDKIYVSELFGHLSQLWYFQEFFLKWLMKNTYYREEIINYLLKYGEAKHLLSLATVLNIRGGQEILARYRSAIISQLEGLGDARVATKWAIHFKDYDIMRNIIIRHGEVSDYCYWFRYITNDDNVNELKIHVIKLGIVNEVVRSVKSKVPTFSREYFYSTLPKEYQLGVII